MTTGGLAQIWGGAAGTYPGAELGARQAIHGGLPQSSFNSETLPLQPNLTYSKPSLAGGVWPGLAALLVHLLAVSSMKRSLA